MQTTPDFADKVRALAARQLSFNPHEADRDRKIARRLMSQHDHVPLRQIPKSERGLVWENCAACVLARAGRDQTDPRQMPNYAGWLRVYIQAGEAVPLAWLEAEMKDAETRHPAYYNAILRDVATHGLHRAHLQRKCRKGSDWRLDLGIDE